MIDLEFLVARAENRLQIPPEKGVPKMKIFKN